MSPRLSRPLALGVSAALAAGGLLLASPDLASAAPASSSAYGAYAYGSTVRVGPVSSGATAPLSTCTNATGDPSTNNALAVDLGLLGKIGAVTSSNTRTKDGDALTSTTTTETAGFNLLAGVISADAVKVTSEASYDGSKYATTGDVTFTNLKVAGIVRSSTPGVAAKISIPGVATVTLNGQTVSSSTGGFYERTVEGIRIDLLKNDLLNQAAGTIVIGNAAASLHTPTSFRPYGTAYGTQLDVAGVISSGPSIVSNLPCGGSGGATKTSNAASINLPKVAQLGAVKTWARSTDNPGVSTNATFYSSVSGINLLDGVVTADAVTSRAQATRKESGLAASSDGSVITNLKINGEAVTVAVKENTKINIAGVGTLTLRKVVKNSLGIDVYGLELKINTDQVLGPKAGTTLQVAVAKARVATS